MMMWRAVTSRSFARVSFARVQSVGNVFGHHALQSKIQMRAFSTDAISHQNMRNIAIIAHVDHGKTTLVDSMFAYGAGMKTAGERVMDSGAIEKERGITILSKCTSVKWDSGKERFHINIVDTPGHADFGGEVERIMNMVDGVCLVVDAAEGPMTQTKFVLMKALARGLKPMVVINKVDREIQRVGDVETEVFDLFADLDANDDQLDFPIMYASGKNGWATPCADTGVAGKGVDMRPLFEMIVDHVPAPQVEEDEPFTMLVTQIFSNQFFGKCLLGRISKGKVKVGDSIKCLNSVGEQLEETRVMKLIAFDGLEQVFIDEAKGGHIVAIAGFKGTATVGHTLCNPAVTEAIESTPIDPPTVCMTFGPNDSPLVGKEGNAATSAMIYEWLQKEAETNVSIVIKKNDNSGDPLALSDGVQVFGRGELQLGIIIENMRRQGFELSVGPPQVVYKRGDDGEPLEPIEDVRIECLTEHANIVVEKMTDRKGEMQDMVNLGETTRLTFHTPTRGLMGYRNEFLNDTRGKGVLNYMFHGYSEYKGIIKKSQDKRGAMVSVDNGQATTYSLDGLQSRGTFFIKPGDRVYAGMIIGEVSKAGDMECNPMKSKQLTNVRAAGKDDKAKLAPPVVKALEATIADIRDDEVIEVTTKSIRLRKRLLDSNARKKFTRSKRTLLFSE